MNKNNSVTYMEYFYFKIRVSRTYRKSLRKAPYADSKTLKFMNCVKSSSSKNVPVAFFFPLFLADLKKKYRNDSEFGKE